MACCTTNLTCDDPLALTVNAPVESGGEGSGGEVTPVVDPCPVGYGLVTIQSSFTTPAIAASGTLTITGASCWAKVGMRIIFPGIGELKITDVPSANVITYKNISIPAATTIAAGFKVYPDALDTLYSICAPEDCCPPATATSGKIVVCSDGESKVLTGTNGQVLVFNSTTGQFDVVNTSTLFGAAKWYQKKTVGTEVNGPTFTNIGDTQTFAGSLVFNLATVCPRLDIYWGTNQFVQAATLDADLIFTSVNVSLKLDGTTIHGLRVNTTYVPETAQSITMLDVAAGSHTLTVSGTYFQARPNPLVSTGATPTANFFGWKAQVIAFNSVMT